jgi:putative SOS response-associated peptidase YedK
MQARHAGHAARRHRRCLVLADGYFEWQAAGKHKQPYLFQLRGAEPFAFAGLWEQWSGADAPIETCAIITTDANELSRPVHDRMPAILGPAAWARWIDSEIDDAALLVELLRPYPSAEMESYPVGKLVNSPKNDRSELVLPLAS